MGLDHILDNKDNSAITRENEFVYRDQDFNFIKDFVYKNAGIVLSAEKKVLVYARLSKRLREMKLHSFAEYCRILSDPNAPEVTYAINPLTTNLTRFFRESHHFDFLKDTVFKEFKNKNPDRGTFRLWSAGCSSGEESYSIAMVAAECLNLNAIDFKILATDIDSQMIQMAEEGHYRNIADIPKNYAQRFCDVIDHDHFKIKQSVKDMIHFKRLNLLEPWPMKKSYDVIFAEM